MSEKVAWISFFFVVFIHHMSVFTSLLFLRWLLDRSRLDKLDELVQPLRHEAPEGLRNDDPVLRLVVLQQGTDAASGRTHGGIQHVNKFHL